MASILQLNLLLIIPFSVFLISSAQTCSNHTFSLNRVFKACADLPYLEAHLHWSYIPSLDKVSIAYRARQVSEGWIAWAINPTSTGMVGAQALVAFRNTNGSMSVYPTSITSYSPSMLPEQLSFQVSNISAEYKNNEMTIYALLGPLENVALVNHLWQAGTLVETNIPQIHSTSPQNLQSVGVIDFRSM